MAEKREPISHADERTRVEKWTSAAVLAGIAFLLSWPFLIAPGRFLYIRYFDADTIFGPWWKLHDLVGVWDSQLHLGYAHARDLSYLSVQEVASVLMTPLGADFRNRISLSSISLLIFFAFWWYLRVRFPRVPGSVAALAAFFYAANPFVVAFIHDGYSGLLMDYALLPVALLIVEWSRSTNRPVLISLIPIVFVLTGMYNLTSVLVALIGVIALEYRYIYGELRSSALVTTATALGFALNLYWLVPLLYDLTLHPRQPILAESGNDISVLTSAGTLTNAFLLRSFPEIWTKAYGARECTGCVFYESPWFVTAMLFVAVCAIAGLLRAKRYGLFAALAASIVIATGYHYQNEIIGIPYVVLMGLPLFDTFRSSVKFSALTATFYSLGLIYFYVTLANRRALFAVICAVAVTLIAFPYIFGNIIERSADDPPHFPNFVVSIPGYYDALKKQSALLSNEAPTLLLPNTPLATYRWGAYGNDFLPPLLGKPTLAVSYLPQPSWQLEQILQKLTAPSTSVAERRALLDVLGISRVIYRDDVTQTRMLPKLQFGKPLASFGAVEILSDAGALPTFFRTDRLDPVVGVAGIASYAGLLHRTTRGVDDASDPAAVCAGQEQAGIEPLPVRRHRNLQTLDISFACSSGLTIEVWSGGNAPGTKIIDSATGRRAAVAIVGKASAIRLRFTMPPGPHSYRIERASGPGAMVAVVGRRVTTSSYTIGSLAPQSIFAGYQFPALPAAHYTVFNRNFDPAWAGYVKISGRWHAIRNFMADGFANAWEVPPGAPLRIVNTLVVAAWIAAAVTLLILALYLYIMIRVLRARV